MFFKLPLRSSGNVSEIIFITKLSATADMLTVILNDMSSTAKSLNDVLLPSNNVSSSQTLSSSISMFVSDSISSN